MRRMLYQLKQSGNSIRVHFLAHLWVRVSRFRMCTCFVSKALQPYLTLWMFFDLDTLLHPTSVSFQLSSYILGRSSYVEWCLQESASSKVNLQGGNFAPAFQYFCERNAVTWKQIFALSHVCWIGGYNLCLSYAWLDHGWASESEKSTRSNNSRKSGFHL